MKTLLSFPSATFLLVLGAWVGLAPLAEGQAPQRVDDGVINFVAWTKWSATSPVGVYPDGLRVNYNAKGGSGLWALLELDTSITDRCGCRVRVKELRNAALNAPNQSHRLDKWKGFQARMTLDRASYAQGQAAESVARDIKITSNHCITD